MATCGEYELERAIGWGRRATFFAARASGAVESTIVIRRARSGERAFTQTFLRAAAEQQAAVVAGCRRLAPIFAFEFDGRGFAYYATTRYETSLAEFIEAGCKVDGALLREITTSILGALAELHEKSRRAHGKLTPGNVLLDPDGRIFLTDLAPAAKDAGVADDLFDLGALIYQLVRRTLRIGMLNPPLDYSQDWTDSLGDEAEGWLAFTNRLLDKRRNQAADAIKSALADVKSLAALAAKEAKEAAKAAKASGDSRSEMSTAHVAVRRPPKKRKSWAPLLLALVVLLGAGGGGYWWWKRKEDEKRRQAEREKELAAQTERDKTLPPALQNLRSEIKQLPPEIAADATLNSRLQKIARSLDGSWTRDSVESDLREWTVANEGKARGLAATWKVPPREWTRLAGELESSARIDASGDLSIVAQLRRAITSRTAAEDLDRQWAGIASTLRSLADAKNRLLPDFTPWAAAEIRGARDFPEAALRATAAAKTLADLLDFQQAKWPRVVATRFEKDAADVLATPSDDLMPGWPGRWKREAERLVGPSDAKRAEWERAFAEAARRIPKSKPGEQPAWQKKLADARAAADAALDSDVAAVDRQVAQFAGLRLQVEILHEQFTAFLTAWKARAAGATKDDAPSIVAEFKDETSKLLAAFKGDDACSSYLASIGAGALVDELGAALRMSDKISLAFAEPAAGRWRAYSANEGAAVYVFDNKVVVPFVVLGDTGFAMSAIETPLNLAQASGVGAAPPGSGPKIRDDKFAPDASTQWLWKQPLDFIAGAGLREYFAPGVQPGDTTSPTCPVTWISFAEARTMAQSLGGTLPTAAQWAAAKPRPNGPRRLRAGAWKTQVAQVLKWNAKFQTPTRAFLPDVGSFSKQTGLSGSNAYLNDSGTVIETGDGFLWLRSVYPSDWKPATGWKREDGFEHLIGNAAEWVDDNGTPAVIGGSVVSPKSLPTNTPLPIQNGPAAFDVTFRLVVRLGEGGQGAGLDKFRKLAANIPLPAAPKVQ